MTDSSFITLFFLNKFVYGMHICFYKTVIALTYVHTRMYVNSVNIISSVGFRHKFQLQVTLTVK